MEPLLTDASPIVQKASLASVRLLLSRWHWDGRAEELELLRNKVTPVLMKRLDQTMDKSLGETMSLVGGTLLVDALKQRVADKSLTSDVRGTLQSVLSLVERAERRRNN